MSNVYIIYSNTLNRFYIGACQVKLSDRIAKHNSGYYGNESYTAQATDWKLFEHLTYETFAHAIRLERKIKSMKSRVYIENLKKYPELREKIWKETK